MATKRNPRAQGDLGELSAINWLTEAGAVVSLPMFHSPDYDLIADRGGSLTRVQVKTSVAWHKDRFVVSLCTRGGNQSWNRVIKRLDATRCDSLFVHVGDGRRWYMPVAALGGGSGILLGGPKYAEYEIDLGQPLPAWVASLDSPDSRRDTRAVKGTAL